MHPPSGDRTRRAGCAEESIWSSRNGRIPTNYTAVPIESRLTRYRRTTCVSSAENTAQSPDDEGSREGIGAGRFAIRPNSGRDTPARRHVERSWSVSAGPLLPTWSSFFSAEGFFESGLAFCGGAASGPAGSSGGVIGAFLSAPRCCTGTVGFLASLVSNVGSDSFGVPPAGGLVVAPALGVTGASKLLSGGGTFPERSREKARAPGSVSGLAAAGPAAAGPDGPPVAPGVGAGLGFGFASGS